MQTPSREVAITQEDALVAQDILLAALTTGGAKLTEAEFSSFLTKALESNSGPNTPIKQIVTWIEPEQLYLRLTLKEDVLAAGLGNTLDLVGSLAVKDGTLQLTLSEAAAGPYQVTGAFLKPIADQINAVLAQQIPNLPLVITLQSGSISIQVVQ
ncbi:MAG: hypothetical protein U0175_01710 [Caldilineaceae bacterium]